MKLAFKIMTIFLLVVNSIAAIVGIAAAVTANSLTEGKTGGEAALGGLAVFVIVLSLIPVALTIYMAICGLRGNYNMCFKLSAALMVLNIVSFIATENKASAIFSLVLSIVYCFMAKKMDDGAY